MALTAMLLKQPKYRRMVLGLGCFVLGFILAHVWSPPIFKETKQVYGSHGSTTHHYLGGLADNSPPTDGPGDTRDGWMDGWVDGRKGQSTHKPLISLINRRNISVPATVSVDDRFREEMVGYQRMAIIPADCATPGSTTGSTTGTAPNKAPRMAPPPFVKSQDVYGNCSSPRVPNIMHMVWFWGAAHPFNFIQYLSALSMLRFIRPCIILFWYDGHAPVGDYWENFIANVSAQNVRFEMLQITTPRSIWGKKISYPQHTSDIIRFEALKHFGGMYTDPDVLVVRSTDPLRCYDMTMGRETPDALPNNFMFAVPHSPFLEKVIDNYKNYAPKVYGFNGVRIPDRLSRQFPELVHVEETSINRPNWTPNEIKSIFEEGCKVDLKSKYAVHLWNTALPKQYVAGANATSVKSLHSTFGQIARLVLYGATGGC